MPRVKDRPAWPAHLAALTILSLGCVAAAATAWHLSIDSGCGAPPATAAGAAEARGPRIHVVYFAFLPESDFLGLLDHHLAALAASGLPAAAASVQVVLSTSASSDEDAQAIARLQLGADVAHRHVPTATLRQSLGNTFEYPGIRAAWDTAQTQPEAHEGILLYFHSKGRASPAGSAAGTGGAGGPASPNQLVFGQP